MLESFLTVEKHKTTAEVVWSRVFGNNEVRGSYNYLFCQCEYWCEYFVTAPS